MEKKISGLPNITCFLNAKKKPPQIDYNTECQVLLFLSLVLKITFGMMKAKHVERRTCCHTPTDDAACVLGHI